jgi:hypothetical protein
MSWNAGIQPADESGTKGIPQCAEPEKKEQKLTRQLHSIISMLHSFHCKSECLFLTADQVHGFQHSLSPGRVGANASRT